MNHQAHEDDLATKDTKVTKIRKAARRPPKAARGAITACFAGRVERLLVILVFFVAESWIVNASVTSVAADVSL